MRLLLTGILCIFILSSASAKAPKNRLSPLTDEPIQPLPAKLAVNTAKADLGKMLFFEPRLSKSGGISCSSCHNLASGGDDNMPTSIGHRWQLGPINAPTVLNAALHFAQFWDGRAANLVEQAKGPIQNPKEMASSHELAVSALQSMPEYGKAFAAAGYKTIAIQGVAEAIAEFEKTLLTPNSRFDQYLMGKRSAINAEEAKGYALFKEVGCIACHNGVNIGGNSYQRLGVFKPFRDTATLGRFNVTKQEEDKFFFKVPTLRNIALTAPYFHDGKTWDLAEAVTIMADLQLGKILKPEETSAIVAFLQTLTGDQPKIQLPVLPAETTNTPRPDPL